MKFWDSVGDPSYVPTPLPDCLCHIPISRYLGLSLKVVEKPNKSKRFWPQLLLLLLLPLPLLLLLLLALPTCSTTVTYL